MLDGIVDVSHWDPIHDPAAMRAAGIVAVVAKATEGLNLRDDQYQRNRQASAGLLFGAYHFLDHGVDPVKQADFFIDTVKPDGSVAIALDFEAGAVAEAEAFAQRIYDIAGLWPMLYTRASYITAQIGSKATLLSKCPLWDASYRDAPLLPPQWGRATLHQYTNGEDGPEPHVTPGVGTTGHADRSRFDGTLDELRAFWQAITPRATPVVIPPLFVNRWVKATLLNVRAGPGTQYTALAHLAQGTQVSINGARIANGFAPYTMPDGREGWVSTLWLNDWPPTSTPPQPVAAGNKLSFHYQAGGNNAALLEVLRTCHIPGLLLMRYGWQGELSPADVKAVSPTTEIMLRPWQQNETQPDWSKPDLYTAGRAFPAWVKPESGVDFWQIINEPGYGPGTPSFWQGALDEANARGVKLAVGCFATGNPKLPGEDPAWWNAFYPVLRRCKAEGHALMLHQYLIPDPGTKDWSEPWGIMRHKQLYAQLPDDLKDLPLRIGEFGTMDAAKSFSTEEYVAGLKQAGALLAQDSFVRWAALWTVGGAGTWADSLIDGKLLAIEQYLKSA